MSRNRLPGSVLRHDPDASVPYGFDWTAYLAELGAGVTLASSEWLVQGPDDVLVVDDDSIGTNLLTTQAFLSGGTSGARYLVTNRITTNTAPVVTDDRSFYVRVSER